jgi:hypothetical protein
MRLADLRPEYFCRSDGRGGLMIDCPLCGSGHRFNIPTMLNGATERTGIKRWGITGSPPDWNSVSITPSVDLKERCQWHGAITLGVVEPSSAPQEQG